MKAEFNLANTGRARAALAKLSKIRGELAWVILGQAISALAALVGVRLMTGLLRPAEYGELALGMTVALLITQSLFGPLTNGIARFYAPAAELDEVGGYLLATRRLAAMVTGTIVALAILGSLGLLALGHRGWIALGLASAGFATLTGYNNILSAIQNAARQRSVVALHQGIEAWTRFGFAALLILWFGATSEMAVTGYGLGIIVVLVSQYAFFRRILARRGVAHPRTDWQARILGYSWPFYLWCMFTWAQLASDRWALAWFADARQVGLYAVLYQIGNYPIAIMSAMSMQLLAPIFYERAGDGQDRERNARVGRFGRNLTLVALGVTAVAVCAGLALHAPIFRVFVAAKYASVSYLLPYSILASGIFAASQLVELSLMSQMKTNLLVMAKITTALLGIALNFAGARWYGVPGVVGAGVAISLIYLTWMAVLAKYLTSSPPSRLAGTG